MRAVVVRTAVLAAVVAAALVAPATMAGASGTNVAASKLWVSNAAPSGAAPGSSCTRPGYSTVQSAIDAAPPGATVEICAGTYVEQLTITRSVSLKAVGAVTVELPSSPQDSATTCDDEITANGYQAPQDEISICGARTVSMTGITVSAYWPADTCYDSLYGVFVGAGSHLVSKTLTVDGAGVPIGDPDVGCQGGVAIQVGSDRSATPEAASAVLTDTTVSGYQKNGITATGAGAAVTVHTATVTGRGPVGTAENGIEVAFGAKGTIAGATVTDNQCQLAGVCGPDGLNDTQATGVLFYGAASGSSLTDSAVSGNDTGVYYGSTSAAEPSSPEVTISSDRFSGSADEQVLLDQGVASVKKDRITGTGNVGIEVLQYAGQTYAPASTAAHDTISGQGVGVRVYSDNAPSDIPGAFTISNSRYFTGNTVASEDNSSNYFIEGVHNS